MEFRMETELSKLYRVTEVYKKTLVKIINKIDENVLRAIDICQNTPSPTNKYQISIKMTQVIQNYLTMIYTCEKLDAEIESKTRELEHSIQPEREYNSNPFRVQEVFEPEFNATREPQNAVELTFAENNTTEPFKLDTSDASSRCEIENESSDASSRCGMENEAANATNQKTEIIETNENELSEIQNEAHVLENCPPLLENFPQEPSVSNLSDITLYDRKQEAIKLIENKKLKKVLKWDILTSKDKPQKPKEEKSRKKPHIEICDTHLRVNQKCIISHIESPSEFYVRIDQNLFESFESRFNSDMNKQHQYVVNKYKTKIEARSQLGNFCFAFLSDRHKWFRLEILDWMLDEVETVYVQLIDYGEKLYCSYKNLKLMSDLHGLFSKMAVRCHLAGLYSPCPDNKSWPQSTINFFINLCELSQKTQFVIIFACNDGASNAVELRKSDDPHADCLGELLIKHNHAFEVKISPNNCLDMTEEEDDFEEFGNLNEAIAGYDAQDEARICPFAQRPEGCFKGPACKLEHKKFSKDGVTTDKILTVNIALATLVLPAAGETIDILITGYINTCHFYANILKERNNEGMYNGTLQRLMETMNANNVVQTYESFKIFPGMGELLLVKHELEWHRGRCVGYDSIQVIHVFLVDLGYKIVKTIKDLRQMKDDFLHIPFQAIECMLSDCQEIKEPSSSPREFFDEIMHQKVFRALVMESVEPLRLILWDSDGLNMTHVLHQWGLVSDRNLYLNEPSVLIRN